MSIIYPKPQKLNEELFSIKEVDKHRKIDCIFYEHCLDHAAHFRYKSFTCRGCLWYYKHENKEENNENCQVFKKIVQKKLIKYNLIK